MVLSPPGRVTCTVTVTGGVGSGRAEARGIVGTVVVCAVIDGFLFQRDPTAGRSRGELALILAQERSSGPSTAGRE
jgi:hypothetical protein